MESIQFKFPCPESARSVGLLHKCESTATTTTSPLHHKHAASADLADTSSESAPASATAASAATNATQPEQSDDAAAATAAAFTAATTTTTTTAAAAAAAANLTAARYKHDEYEAAERLHPTATAPTDDAATATTATALPRPADDEPDEGSDAAAGLQQAAHAAVAEPQSADQSHRQAVAGCGRSLIADCWTF